MSLSAATLLLPAPDAAWRVWKPRASSSAEALENPSDAAHLGKPLVIGLPASSCRTIGLLLPQADSELMEQILVTQLERRGFKLEQDSAGKNYRWHLLGTLGGQSIISVDLLADPFPAALAAEHASDRVDVHGERCMPVLIRAGLQRPACGDRSGMDHPDQWPGFAADPQLGELLRDDLAAVGASEIDFDDERIRQFVRSNGSGANERDDAVRVP